MFMKKNKDVLKIILVALIAVFVMVGIAAALLVGYRKSEEEEKAKQQAMDVLESIPRLTPTVVALSLIHIYGGKRFFRCG